VLHSREDVSPPDELDPQRYGVIVSAVDGRCGVLLPGIEGINTGEAQLRLAREKGWIGPDEPVKVERFQVDHFEEPA
jgi:AMMECR1 domain-containing protein